MFVLLHIQKKRNMIRYKNGRDFSLWNSENNIWRLENSTWLKALKKCRWYIKDNYKFIRCINMVFQHHIRFFLRHLITCWWIIVKLGNISQAACHILKLTVHARALHCRRIHWWLLLRDFNSSYKKSVDSPPACLQLLYHLGQDS